MRSKAVISIFMMILGFIRVAVGGITQPAPGQSFPPGTTSVVIEWEPVPGAESYELQLLLNDSLFRLETNLTGTAWTNDAALPAGYYTALIRAVSGAGPGAWSDPVTFLVRRAMSPAGNLVLPRTPRSLKWDPSPAAQGYRIKLYRLDPVSGASTLVRKDQVPAADHPRWTNVPVLANGQYRWSVTDLFDGRAGFTSTARFRIRKVENMVFIPSGRFMMGDAFGEGSSGELPVHPVYVSAIFMDRHEVTRSLWFRVRNWSWSEGSGYSYTGGGNGKAFNHPVYRLDWYDMVKWCNARSEMEGRKPVYYEDPELTRIYKSGVSDPYVDWEAPGYRLPTEAEWEKAARGGGSGRRFSWSDRDSISHARANYYSVAGPPYDVSRTRGYHPAYHFGGAPYTSPVGSFAPNGYGLYDMIGNIKEWCWDVEGLYDGTNLVVNPRGPDTMNEPGLRRIVRGGAFDSYGSECRVSARGAQRPAYLLYGGGTVIYYPFIGFRTVISGHLY